MIEYAELEDSALQKLAADGDSYAEEELVSRYMRLVRICARPLFLAGGESEDLIQEGMFGLLSAVRQYNNEHNASFKTFAEWCIRNRLRSAVKSASSLKHDPRPRQLHVLNYFRNLLKSRFWQERIKSTQNSYIYPWSACFPNMKKLF